MPQIASGNLRALAVTVPPRLPDLPNVPTLAEAGVSEVVAQTWFALMAPASTPAPIVKKLEAASRQIVASDDFKSKVEGFERGCRRQHGGRIDRAHACRNPALGIGGEGRQHQVRIIGNAGSIRLWSALRHAAGFRRNRITE